MKLFKSKDKRKIILEHLYKNHHTDALHYCDIRPLMKDWSKDEINHTLDSLLFRQPELPPLIKCDHLGEFSWTRIDRPVVGRGLYSTAVTKDNYKADAIITPEGEKHYREVYENAKWKSFILKTDAIGKIPLLVVAVVSIVWNIYSVQTIANLKAEQKKSIDSLKIEMRNFQSENVKSIQELKKKQPTVNK